MNSTTAINDWETYLDGLTPCRFPRFTRPVKDTATPLRQTPSARVGIEQADKLLALSTADPDGLAAVLATAWALLLQCYTGQDDVSFSFQRGGGDVTSEAVVARFLLDGDSGTVSETLVRAQAALAGDLPPVSTRLLRAGGSGQPLFDTAIVLRDFTERSAPSPISEPQNQKLRLLAKRGDDSLSLFLEWSSTPLGITATQGTLVASTLNKLLSGILACPPNAPLRSLNCLSQVNLDQVCAWNDSYSIHPVERCVHDVIADQVLERPDAEAVCAWDGSLTYRELDAVTGRLAARLVALGVGREVLVPLCFEKSKWTPIAMLAVLRAGGAFVPLDPSHPVERLRGLCDSVGAQLLLCSGHLVQTLAGVVETVLPVDDSTITDSDGINAVSLPVTSGTNAAYVIFTSGSTGKPKGTVIEHRAFCSSARAHAPALRIDGTCRVLQFAAHTFDASLVEILTPLMVGGCVCVPSEHDRLNDLAGAMNRMGVDHAVLTPSFINFLTPATVPGLRRLVLAGEAMSPSHVSTWSHIELVNGYGPAESSVAAVVNSRVGPETEATDIGMPCGVRVWLVDLADHHRLVPVGCVGEMILEGPSLARGYLNDPGKTEESFVSDLAWAQHTSDRRHTGRRFYKTGDLARYNSAVGSLSYVGRKDTQIKLHGQRIELGEIEHHLAVDESVQHALVLLPKQGPLAKRLITILSLSDLAVAAANSKQTNGTVMKLTEHPSLTEPILQRIRMRLEKRLPAYMVPSTWLCVEAIPMLPSRKMDRKTVATWVGSVLTAEQCQEIIRGHHASEPNATPEDGGNNDMLPTEVETKLRDIWSLVLNFPADQINPSDRSFLSLGGDSISAMACASHAKKARLGVSVQDVLKAKSLRQLAAVAKPMDQTREEQGDSDHELEGALNTPFELTPIQQLHFEARAEAQGDEHFNQSFCLRLARRVDEAAIREALEIVVGRHAMLRARFAPGEGGQWKQCITADVEASYRFRTHTILSRAEADAGIASAQGCLNVRQGPLFATELFSLQESGEQILFMTVHHLVVDLVSWRVILEEIEELLKNPQADKVTLTVHRSLPFRKWAALQTDDCAGTALSQVLPGADQVPTAQFAYWGMNDQPNLYGDVACEGFEVDAATTTTLLNECHNPFGTETVELLLAALIWSFQSTFTDRSAPAIFNEGHGREPPQEEIDIARTIGWFTTLFPVALSSPATFADALIQTKDLRRRVPGNGRPYFATRFHKPEGRERWGPHHRDMEVSFNFLGRYQQLERAGALFQPAEGALMAGEAHPGSPTADFGHRAPRFSLFEISAVIIHGALRFGFAWNGGMRHQERIREWVAACREVLVEAAATLPSLKPRITASDLKLLPELTSADLGIFERTQLANLVGERGWDAIEDVYPTSPIQQGLLLSRTKDGNFYAVRRAFQVKAGGRYPKAVDAARVVQAWKQVVQHHALLRTVFVDAISPTRAGSYDQVVLKSVEPPMLVSQCPGGESEMHSLVENMEPMQYRDETPQHRFSVLHSKNSLVCVLEMSHAIMDGASMDILLRDLGRAYDGALDRLPKPLFSPFVARLQQRSVETDVAFWTAHLAGLEPCHFPVLNDGVNVPETERELCTLRVEFPGLAALQEFCSGTGFTLPNAFHAAWALTLAYYTGTDDVCFGFLVSGRDAALEGFEDAVGPFINMATQRVKLASDGVEQLSLLHLLEVVQRDQLDCMPYAQTSLAEVQHALNLPGGMALFDTCISYRRQQQKLKDAEESFVCEDLGAIHDPTEYPISLNIEMNDEGGAAIDLDYWTDAVASHQAKHVAATFLQALRNIAEHAGTPVSQLDTVHHTSKEHIWTWNANMPATTVDCVHRMVEKQVALRPQAQAIRGWDGDFSYEELNNLANCLASHLVNLGVGPETLVPVCFDKSAWTTISMLAVLKAGGGVVPLDATHPASALEGKVADAGAHIVVASEARAMLFEAMVPHVVAVGPELLSQLPAASSKGEIQPGVTPENPAFIMFTSGSTGKPKGVVLCHQALVSSAFAHGSALGLGPHTRFLQFAAHTFDNSLEEMFTTLIHGGCVCVPSDADRLGDLPGAIDRLDANFMDLTPTVAALIRPEQVPKIRGMAVGGEALTREVLDTWGGAVPVHNQYGPSECSINSAHKLHLDKHGDVGNIGTSVGSVSWVVDPKDHNRLVPVGCVGELLIEGPILARGYLNKPVETVKAFIEMPRWAPEDPHHAERANRRMYKTGDLVRYNSDGSLIYLGRKDTQVKLHGQRIELGEIEHHVKTHLPPTAQSSVELVAPGQSKKALAVFVCVSPSSDKVDEIQLLPMDAGFKSLAQAIVGAMATQVASYMVPSLFLPVTRMPLTSSGKLDRRCLRTMAQALDDKIAEYRLGTETAGGRAPETPMEKHLQELWAAVLNLTADSISADDSFFSHGGDSVGAMRLAAAARQRGIVLTVANIFQSPKLYEMANTVTGSGIDVGGKSGDSSASTVVEDEPLPGPAEAFSLLKDKAPMTLERLQEHVATICHVDVDSIEDIYPCNPLQAGLVAASQRQPGAYVAVNLYELPVGIDVSRFKRAWQEVVDSEAILRTRVVFVENIGFLQVVVKGEISWTTAASTDGLSGANHRHLPPHDGGILSRYTILGEQSSKPTFTWTAHHAIYDGWSLPTLLSRVEARYRHPEAPIISSPHYSRFVEYLSGLDTSASDAFWSEKLSGPGTTHFPQLPHPGYRVQATSQVCRPVHFTRPKGANLPMASFLRVAWAMVVGIYSLSDDIVFGEILSGRDIPVAGVEDLVGPTLASVPRRIRIDRAMSVHQLLADVQAQLSDVIPHQFAGLQRIKALNPAAAAACDFKNLLAIDMADDVAEDSLWSNMTGGGTAQGPDFFSLPLNVTCTLGRNNNGVEEIQVRAIFDAEVVPQWQVARMLGQFETVLSRLSAPESQREKVGDVDLLSPDDKAMLREWNKVPGLLVERRVHDMICDEMARQGSDATAVVGWDATLSNGELDVLSTALAGELLSKGVGANGSRFVPFCFDKSTFAVVAMLAVLKAGAAFVPLDPAHPVGRLREIVGDCAADVILCSPKYESLCTEVVKTVLPVDMATLKKLQDATTAISILEVSHTAFCSGGAAHGPAMLMTPPFRFLQFASYTFDACLVEILTTLMMGGTVCVPREEDRTNGNIATVMEQMGVTMTLLTPSFARVLDPASVPSLKTLILGGEAMAQGHLATWADRLNLVNAYGPSECAVVATVNPQMSRSSNPANLGRGIGRCWIVDPQNHNRLAPLGSVGELLVEGPTLSTGYLRNETKTREVFVDNLRWALDAGLRYPDMASRTPRRMYKTGDLVRVCDDVSGEMVYMGRKDASQAKLNGQRLELDEIVHHLAADDAVRHAVVVLPRSGPCVKRLVAVLSLRGVTGNAADKFELVASREASLAMEKIQERLREKLPAYMVPSTWILLQAIPLLPSGKLDRNSVAGFVEGMSEETLDKINAADSTRQAHDGRNASSQPNLPIDERLKSIWSQVLNIAPERIGRNVSFLHLGGDSITAMQVMARCRSQGITVAVSDIIGSKSVHDLALRARVPKDQKQVAATTANNEDHHEFDPAPIQQLYFQLMHVGNNKERSAGSHMQFNQSVLLRLAKNTNSHELGRGLHALVETHSMLRARFRRDGTGNWRQRITSDVSGSYRFKTHVIGNVSRMEKRIQTSQSALDIQKGPLLAVDWFSIGKDSREVYVFIAVHHLVVDVVSWGILLQDIEDFLATGSLKPPVSLSFQTWSRGQSEQAQTEKNGPGLLPHHEVSNTDLEYWGMTGTPNVHGDVVPAGDVELDNDTTALLLGPECHAPLQTEVLDVLLAALLLSYRNVSGGRRGVPTIYNEGHGREAWDDTMDLSRTVGWFTTLYPVHLPDESSSDDDILSAIRWVKDYRGRLAGKGRPYFAYQLLTSQGRDEYDHDWPVEVAFNYLGQMQQLSRTDTFLQPFDSGVGQGVNTSSDIGNRVPRFALIEVSAVVVGGKMRMSFAYNKHMKHQDSLKRWVKECQSLLQEAPRRLMQHTPQKTLGAFPLLPLAYYGLENLDQRLRDVGIRFGDVEDVYPCSPMQRGLLLSQMRDPEKYGYKAVFQVESSRQEGIDSQRLCDAWQAVVRRHSTLRTIFVDTVGDEGLMDQVVLRSAPGRIQVMLCGEDEDALQMLQATNRIDGNEKKPPHRLSLCKTTRGHIFCQLEISHAISDGSSVPILLDDLADAYGQGMINKPVPLYRDYIAYIQSQPRSESIRYWKGYLGGAEPCLLPTLTDGESDLEPSLGSHAITLGSMSKVNDYCMNSGITLSTLLQFVWALVVRSYTGADEVLFGYLASGRDIPVANIEQAVGAFINMLVCRLRIPADTEVGEALDMMRGDLADAMAHQSCSLAEMQHELRLPGTALFNTAFTYQKRTEAGQGPRQHSSQSALQYRVVTADDPSEYAVAVNVEATDKTVEVHFSYWQNIVSDAQIQNIATTFEQALSDLVADGADDRTVGELDLVASTGIEQIRSWNNYELPRVEQCVHGVIEQHALHRPASTPAVCGWDASFTYRELDKAAAALARHLVAHGGVGPEVFVPLCFEKSAWTIVAQLAVLKAGGAFVNLDPSHPNSRLEQLIQDVGAKTVLCSAKHEAKMNKIANRTFVVDAESIATLGNTPGATITSAAKPSNPAYIIFTSGTTGKPKGTVIEHGAFCTGGIAHAKAMFMHSDSRVLQFASYTFDASIMETLSCLLVGGCVCVPSDEERMNDVAAVIRNMGVTWTLLTPSVASTVKPESVTCLKTLVTGGEAMAPGHISRWGTQCALVNAYGPTECSVVATTSTKVDESRLVCNNDRSNIGTAVGGRVWVVDPHTPDRLVPVGAVGELVVEGRLVARGYLNNKEQTEKAFIRSPEWARHPGFPESMWLHRDSMYRTGDLVRYNSDGSISYIARKDTQIKLNGRRIELGEIEFHCRTGLPDDAQSAVEVVLPANNRTTTKSLAVFFSFPSKEASTPKFSLLPMGEPLRNLALGMETHLSSHLPSYMVPQLFVPVSVMPWTSAGKLDRRQLRQALEELNREIVSSYRLSAAAAAAKHRGVASEMEKRLQSLWESVLGLSTGSVGTGDSFFRLGGDSLTAMRLVGAARAHKIVLTVLDVFEKPVLADMARACGGLEAAAAPPPELKPFDLVQRPRSELDSLMQEVSTQCHLSHGQVQDMYPCSPLQEGLVTLANKQEGAYVAVNTLKLPEHVDLDRFKAAWQEVVAETDTLRTRIVHTAASGFLQIVVAPEPIDWYEEPSLEEALVKGRALGLQNGGALTRYAIVEAREDRNEGPLFVWAIHHALYDGWSLRLLARQVQDVYNNSISGSQKSNDTARASYANFIHYLAQRDMDASERFWKDSLCDASSITHFPQLPPMIASQSETPSFRTETRQVNVRRNGILIDITVPTLIRAAWAIVLAAYTGMDDVVFGETLAGRNIDVPGVTEMAGPTFTTVPTRVRLGRDTRLVDFLRDMHSMASRVVPHQHLGLQHIKRLGPDCAGACDFQNLLVIQTSSPASTQQEKSQQHSQEPDWDFQGGSSTDSFFTHPLVLECTATDTTIEATFHYDEKVLSKWHAKRLVHQFEAVLKRLAGKSGSKDGTLADIHAISPEDQALIARWNRTGMEAVDSCIHHLFLEQASADPQRVGISAWDAELTYSEIREYASRLALHLNQLGVGQETLVPVCLERSAWSVVILMGIFMAGGAFVPLDPAHPLSRHKGLLESINPRLIVCSPEHAPRFSGIINTRVSVDGAMLRGLPSFEGQTLPAATTPSNTAYVLFTSGSTGRPKGVVVAHRDFCSSSLGYAGTVNMNASSRVYHFASLTFDAALLEVLTPLTLGACVCVPTAHERLHDLGVSMVRLRATWSFLTPSVANLLDPDMVCQTLKTLVCGGEAMLADTISRWADRLELMNGYGPTETCVFAVINSHVSTEKDPGVIGRGTAAARLWIVDPREECNDRLAPVGAVGELAISGPLVARGYLDDPDKTARVFVESPGWARRELLGGATPPTRIYRTGDLVRYRSDGAIEFVGRRDGQVKVNGQRIELGDIESHLSADRHVRLAAVVQPKKGPCKKQLVGVVTLASAANSPTASQETPAAVTITSGDCQPLEGPPELLTQVRSEVSQIRAHLTDRLPHYMVPAAWVVLETMPVVVSGKLDRQRVARWVEGLDDAAYERIAGSLGEDSNDDESQVTGPVKTLREIWAKELNLPVDRVKLNKPFLGLGGDSIRAMGVVSRARNAKLKLSIRDVLRSKSVVHLAESAKELPSSTVASMHKEEETEQSFALSPIQRMYLNSAVKHHGDARFNQSFTLGVPRRVTTATIKKAIESIVQRHAMLRARFARTKDARWEQRIAKMGPSTYHSSEHHLSSRPEMIPLMAAAQAGLCVERGPVFRVDLFDVADDQDQIIVSMVAHHLCIDMVSWRIIVQDLSQLLETGVPAADTPLSFRSWCAQQSAHNNKTVSSDAETLLPFKETPPDLGYWGTQGPLTYGRTKTEIFSLGEDVTKLALGDCHRPFRSDPVDLFLAAVAHAFAKTFQDRNVPTLHIENHGREAPEGSNVDLSQTVGWFTTTCPVVIPARAVDNDVLDTLRQTKDTRRSIPAHGRPYFAHKYLGKQADATWTPMEVLFNYLGGGVGVQDREDPGSLIRQVDLDDVEGIDSSNTAADVGPETRRLALFEISAIVVNNRLQFTFMYDSSLRRASDVRRWIGACKNTLEEMTRSLVQRPVEPTLSDYPLLPITYDGLRMLTEVALPRVGIDRASCVSQIEDIYPCTPVQEGMLISQLRNPDAYIFHIIYNVKHTNPSHRLDVGRFARTWQNVVNRHAALRTVFIESVRRGGVFDQVVLKEVDCGVVLLTSSDKSAMGKLGEVTMRQVKQPQLPHRLTICTTHSGTVLMKLEVNHAAMDGGSLSIILEELASGYMGTVQIAPGPLYSDYVQYIRSLPAQEDTNYWMRYLKSLQPCYFPNLNSSSTTLATDTRALRSAALQFDRYDELRQLSEKAHVTLANIMHAAWAFVLRRYTDCDDVCFGYLTAGRDAPVENIGRTVGTLINMLCCRVQISRSQTLEDVFRAAQDQHLQSMQFEHCSLARVQHELGLAGKPLYNTSISTQNHSGNGEGEMEETISFDMEEGHDPSEYAITVNIETSRNSEGVVFRYWSDHVSDDQAREVARAMARVLDAFISRPAQSVEELDLELDGNPATVTESADDLGIEKLHDNSGSATPRSMDSSRRTSSERSLETPVNEPAGQSPYEKTLLVLWSAVLHLPEDSIAGQDSFFDLGGDSITAMKLAGEARDCGLPLTVADVFRNPSFDDMVASVCATGDMHAASSGLAKGGKGIITTQHKGDLYERFSLLAASNVDAFLQTSIVPQVCVFRGGISDVLPATDFQSLAVAGALLESRWMLNYFYLDGDGTLNIGQLKRACFRLVQALDILRTVFVPSGGRFLQVVLRTLRPAFHVVETDDPLDGFTVGQEGSEPRIGEPFVEFTVVKHRTSGRHRLFLRISHAQYDGVCFPKILGALQAAYRGETVPRPPSFANYLRASAGALTSEHYRHWKKLLTGASMTEIVRRNGPNYHRNTAGSTATSCLKRTVHLPPVESGHITTATVVKAAWAYVLAQVSASSDVVFGHTISGRNAAVEGVGNMVGPCLNLVPVRVQFGSESGWTARQLLRQVQDQQVANMSHEVLGFREIIRHCTSWPRWTYFTSTVQHQNVDQGGQVRLGDVDYKVGCASAAQEDFADLSVFSQPLEDDEKYEIILSFAEDGAIPRDFAARALDMLCDAAQLFATNPSMALPSADELCGMSQQMPFHEVPSSSGDSNNNNNNNNKTMEADAHLQHLSHAQLTDLSALVNTAWHQALGLDSEQQPTTLEPKQETGPETGIIDKDTSFFALGGDIIGLAQLAWLLDQQQSVAAPRLEELIERPTVRGHMALLARWIPAAAAAATTPAPSSPSVEASMGVQKAATFPMVVQKMARVDSSLKLAKALGLVRKRFAKRKGGDDVMAVA
ncbi:non-ribosomal peptide synthetase [Chaetomidium leptoderma]|uniref:Non-ribosomal peptide synthetase n=1 Tax=Chaetomidium leptoderma TaxID=669021 RepID=A0AAN6VVS2_9PEZI|nr:non-ribosomal peptide synthetase [Chaetomidium leptoderma]